MVVRSFTQALTQGLRPVGPMIQTSTPPMGPMIQTSGSDSSDVRRRGRTNYEERSSGFPAKQGAMECAISEQLPESTLPKKSRPRPTTPGGSRES